MEKITIARGSEENAMAEMLRNLLVQNIAQSRVREAIFDAMNTVVAIHIQDIEVSLTLDFHLGKLTIYDRVAKRPKITVRTESAYVLDLSNISIRFGLPNFFDDKGKEILKNMVSGKIKLLAAPWNFLDVIRLTRVMSINE
jgi:hypothetical protein